MKSLMLFTSALFMSSLTLAQVKPPADGVYKLDAAHSKAGFEISHLVVSTVEGKFDDLEGTVTIDPKVEKSKLEVTIKTASIDTANKDRDDHLKSPDFFDVKKFDKITFKSTKVSGTLDNMKVAGELTMHGVTKPVVLDTKYTGSVKDPWGNERIAFRASTKLNRKDYGLTWSKAVEAGPVVGDEVSIDLKVEAIKNTAKAMK